MNQNVSSSIPASEPHAGMMSVFDEQKPLSQYISPVSEEDTDSVEGENSVQAVAMQLQLQKLRPLSEQCVQAAPVSSPRSSAVGRVEYPLYDGDEDTETDKTTEVASSCDIAIPPCVTPTSFVEDPATPVEEAIGEGPCAEEPEAVEELSEIEVMPENHCELTQDDKVIASATTLSEPQISIFPTDLPSPRGISLSDAFSVDAIIDYQYESPTIRSFVDHETDAVEEASSTPPPVVQFPPELDIISKDEVDDACQRMQPFLGEYPIFERFVSLVRQKRLVDTSFFFDPAFEPDESESRTPEVNQYDETDDLQDFCVKLSPRQQDSLLSFLKTLRMNNDAKRS